MFQLKKFKIFLLFAFLFLMAASSYAQSSILDKKITLSFSDVPLSSALNKIYRQTGVKFSYNPDLIPAGKKISMQFANQPLADVLRQLLNDPGISFREIGNQLVLFRGDPAIALVDIPQKPVAEKSLAKKAPDTVYVHHRDTVTVTKTKTDTVVRTINTIRIDTVRIIDTVWRNKVQKPGRKLNGIFSNSMKQQKFLKNNGLYAGLYAEMLPGSLTYSSDNTEVSDAFVKLMSGANKSGLGKYSVGFMLGYDYLRVGVRSGIGLTRMGEKFEYAYIKESGGFYKTDTVETYYTLKGTDTTWQYVTDSAWIPKDIQKYNYKNPNSYKYLDIPVLVKFRVWQSEEAEIYALGGVSGKILISNNSLYIDPTNDKNTIWTTHKELAPVVLTWQAGLGGAFKIGSYAGVMGELMYQQQLNNQYKDLPVIKKYGMVGLKIGAYIKI